MNNNNVVNHAQVVYLSHGGGPLPLLNDPSHDKMVKFMENLPKLINKPDSIIVFSAHWEENNITIQSGSNPTLMYDYFGFPKAAYSISYPCMGNPELASRIDCLFKEKGIISSLDDKRAYDHGSFIPLKLMYPNADIPVLQVSLNHNLDPITHINMGKALRPLLKENVLIIGSGFSFHNLGAFAFRGEEVEDSINNQFQDKLIDICCREKNFEIRQESLVNWESLPGARYCHPREEHLLPLLVCATMYEKEGVNIFDDYIAGKRATAFMWE